MHQKLQATGLTTVLFPCSCVKNQGICKQRITLLPDQIQVIATDVVSFVAPAHLQQLYCACTVGYSGDIFTYISCRIFRVSLFLRRYKIFYVKKIKLNFNCISSQKAISLSL